MSLYHQLWDRATGERLNRGIAEAQAAMAGRAKTERERGYIDAIAAFYASAATKDHGSRANAYTARWRSYLRRSPTISRPARSTVWRFSPLRLRTT